MLTILHGRTPFFSQTTGAAREWAGFVVFSSRNGAVRSGSTNSVLTSLSGFFFLLSEAHLDFFCRTQNCGACAGLNGPPSRSTRTYILFSVRSSADPVGNFQLVGSLVVIPLKQRREAREHAGVF